MKASKAANWALILSTLSLLLMLYGTAIGIGDPAPWVPEEATAARLRTSMAVQVVGLCVWLHAMGLAGFAFRGARKRALAAWTIGALPALALAAFAFF